MRFDRFVARGRSFDLLIVVDAEGELVAHSSIDHMGVSLDPAQVSMLEAKSYSGEAWFIQALAGDGSAVDQHINPLRLTEPSGEPNPMDYRVGFAEPVWGEDDPTLPVGVVYGLLN